MRDVLAEALELPARGVACVLCTVAETRGSTPQKAGAAMLVRPDGTQAGTLGGGCVEAEVRRRALHRLAAGGGGPEVFAFQLDDDYGWDDGLICGGRMSVLLDPLRPGDAAPLDYLRRRLALLDAGAGCSELVALPGGARFLFDGDNRLAAALPAGEPPAEAAARLSDLNQRPRPSVAGGWAYLPVWPRVTLLIVGGGHVGQAVARLADEVGFEVWVLDDRDRFASAELFPRAARRVAAPIGPALAELVRTDVTPRTYALVVTRGHNHDEEALFHLAGSPAGYVGMIGSRRKVRLIFDDLLARGVPAEALARVRAPLGLDIGSQTVPEIAVSVVAELIARRNLGTPDPAPRRPVAPG